MPFELTPKEEQAIRTCSVERMINTTIRLVNRLRYSNKASIAEDAQVNWQDWHDHKALVVKLWDEAREEVFRSYTNPDPSLRSVSNPPTKE